MSDRPPISVFSDTDLGSSWADSVVHLARIVCPSPLGQKKGSRKLTQEGWCLWSFGWLSRMGPLTSFFAAERRDGETDPEGELSQQEKKGRGKLAAA